MVAGKVRAAMGFQKSPATPKPETPRLRHHNCAAGNNNNNNNNKAATTTTTPLSSSKPSRDIHSTTNSFSRSFGSYFPRSSPAQVRPKPTPSPPPPPPAPPNISDLLRLVEDLQEKESRLRTELLEHKILKETVAIVPFLEKELAAKATELDMAKQKALALEAENQFLKLEMEKLQSKIRKEEEVQEVENRIKEMEDEIEELKRAVAEQGKSNGGAEECCSSNNHRSRGLFEAPSKPSQVRILRRTTTKPVSEEMTQNPDTQQQQCLALDSKVEQGEAEKSPQQQQQPLLEVSETVIISALKSRAPRVPRPPPTPTCSSSSSSSCSSTATSSCSSSVSSASSPEIARRTTPCPKPAPPPPPPPVSGMRPPGPPPPPPPPPKATAFKSAAAKVRRVPEVVEFYHSLMRRDSKREPGGGGADSASTANTKDMIGEIENRSAYLLAIKTDVETQGDFIRFLIKEVENAAFSNIEDVVAFVKWLDDELSFLVDERAVLKHFDWPEKKADAMREAAFGYGDLKKLESEAASYKDGTRQPCAAALKKMQSLLDKLEHGVYNLSRVREAAMKRYKVFGIPGEWMLDTGFVIQIKLASVKLAMQYMKRVSAELESVAGGPEEEELVLQGVRFAFRVHQFAGGFDVETMRAFQELRDKARSCQVQQSQNQGPKYQRLACRA